MIVDTLSNSNIYKQLHKNFATAFDFLQNTDISQLPLGKTIVDGDNVIISINEYTTKSINEAKWEAHKTYGDIQILISGEEFIGYAPIETMTLAEEYNAEKDVLFLEGQGEYLSMKSGKFAIFMPHDAHQPCVLKDSPLPVRKMVVKVKI
jgi:YhcH/YjgK/YiaL family protein